VAKDRAVEGLVLEGGRFTLNVLGQDNASKVSKQLLKPFKPGEPRLKELETEESKAGGAILKDAVSRRRKFDGSQFLGGFDEFFCLFDEKAKVSAGAGDGGGQTWRCLLKDAVSWRCALEL
jgi:hypothetical protein